MQLTKKAHEEFMKELNYLITVKRREIAKAIEEAREHGDLSENSAYHEAKKDQGINEAKIASLKEKLKHAVIIKDEETSDEEVTLGSKVKLKKIGTKDIVEYTVVSELEADIFKNKISDAAPLGSALMYGKVNDIIEIDTSNKTIKYKILKISRL